MSGQGDLLGLDARIWQAIVAGGFVAAGWVYDGWRKRREAQRLREEKLRDAHRALFAEIATFLANLADETALDTYVDAMVARMEADPDFVPFIPKERHDRLFDSIQGEIHVLPRVTIDPVVRYYSQLSAIAALAEDMRGRGFARLSQDRRIVIYRDYFDMRKQAFEYGRIANWLIGVYAEGGKDAAEAAASSIGPAGRVLSTPAADRSAR
ncbi:hypothetical protein [Profundibacterium mesophilum]|uniref:DUF4760 domain-containing protein n=1 Tax=Profundibacterium mesophilum KAUST100406-0324 TaxID=1037889 RepID=A0A921NNY3_9RHOB|nr:hypothetical protein [Profundibacterium mesophilum]KAF0675426.1 hypothetical protein PMES_02316 [Profundibacterium mesophilum KAUST100406-0324]